MFYLYLLCFVSILYYRKFLIRKIFKLFVKLIKWKIDNFNYIKQDCFTSTRCDIVGKYNIQRYDVVHNNKTHNIIFVNETGNETGNESETVNEINDFRSNIDNYLLNKNMIVHCSITGKVTGKVTEKVTETGKDDIIDTTEEFRKFCYYYEKGVILLPFFNHIQNYVRNKGDKDMNIFEYDFTIYLNDSEFTEYTYSIRDILHCSFDMLFESKKFI